jgi:hypothetical protein
MKEIILKKPVENPTKQKPGPIPERVRIDGEWGDAIKKALVLQHVSCET